MSGGDRGVAGGVVRAVAGRLAPHRRWWEGASARERALGGVAFVAVGLLVGAFLFGAVHVVVGGMLKGNWRAGRFGIALSAVTGVLLVAGHLRLSSRFRR